MPFEALVPADQVKLARPEHGCAARTETGNVPLLLAEIRHALERLVRSGTPHTIDLRAIPLGPGEEDALLAALGRGEVRAEFDSMGPTEIQECGYAGVWCVTHRNAGGNVTGRYLEMTYAPDLLASPAEDVSAALERLTAEVNFAGGE
jgi:hydrogenase-1 operon protein HyaF